MYYVLNLGNVVKAEYGIVLKPIFCVTRLQNQYHEYSHRINYKTKPGSEIFWVELIWSNDG